MALIDNAGAQLDIKRNLEYTFTIKTVIGRGYYSVSDAKASVASNTNLDYSVKVVDASGFEIMSNNSYSVAVSNSHFDVYAPAGDGTVYTALTYIHDCVIDFPDKNSITASTGITITSGGTTISENSGATPVLITLASGFTEGSLTLELGSLKKVITVRRQDRLGSVPPIAIIREFMPDVEDNYVSAYTIALDGSPATYNWLQLSPYDEPVRNDPEHIYVDNGQIDLHVTYGTGRTGYVYVTTKDALKRIKVCITQ